MRGCLQTERYRWTPLHVQCALPGWSINVRRLLETGLCDINAQVHLRLPEWHLIVCVC